MRFKAHLHVNAIINKLLIIRKKSFMKGLGRYKHNIKHENPVDQMVSLSIEISK